MRLIVLALTLMAAAPVPSADLPQTIERAKLSVLAIGTYSKTRSPPFVFRGTGFVVGDGTLVATNAHVVPEALKAEGGESLIAIPSAGPGKP